MRFRSRLDRLGADKPTGERPVVLVLAPAAFTADEADRLRVLVGLTRRSAAEQAETAQLLRRAPEIESELKDTRSALLVYASERELKL
jgi:hypothetical protein